jgi:membrane protein DedA with SNARE-associated domain
MILTALVGLFQSLLYDLILFYVGKILSNSYQLRRYLGLNTEDEKEYKFNLTSLWVEKIGKLVMIMAIFSAIYSVFITVTIMSKL